MPVVAMAQARRAARLGVGVDTVLCRYVAGHGLLRDYVMREAECGEVVDRGLVLRGALERLAWRLDRLLSAITGAYREELERLGDGSGASRRGATDASRAASVGGLRRERIMGALVEVVAERGFAGASVELVVARARVSRRTFYASFEGLEDCFGAVIDLGSERTLELVSGAFAGAECWQEGVRVALASLLVFLDSESLLARVWLVESLGAGSWALERRERNLRALRELVVSGWPAPGSWSERPLAAEGAIGAVLGLLHTHLVAGGRGPLIELLGPLMGVVAGPYLDAEGVEREIELGDELAGAIGRGDSSSIYRTGPLLEGHRGELGEELGGGDFGGAGFAGRGGDGGMGGAGLAGARSGRLGGTGPASPGARRARECVQYLAEHPGVSNQEIATAIGIAHKSQISKLLGELVRGDLARKRSQGPGRPNEWRLTEQGEDVARALMDRHQNHLPSIETRSS